MFIFLRSSSAMSRSSFEIEISILLKLYLSITSKSNCGVFVGMFVLSWDLEERIGTLLGGCYWLCLCTPLSLLFVPIVEALVLVGSAGILVYL